MAFRNLLESQTLAFNSKLLAVDARHIENLIDSNIWLLDQLIFRREFEGASRAFSALLSNIRRCPGLIFAIGMMIIYNLPRLHNHLSSNNFFRAIFADGKSVAHELQYGFMSLESTIYKLRHGDLDAAKFGLEDQMHSEYKDKQSTFNGFLGMVSFAKWAFTQDWTISFFLNRRLTIEFGPTLDSTETSEYEMALERLQRSINLDPSNDTFLYFLCLLQLENHRGPAALGAIQHFCKLNPHNPNGFLYQAKILLSMDRPDLVPAEIAAWLRVLDLDPANDIAFAAILQHFRAQRISCATLLLVLVNRIDVSISASESVPVWRLMAAVLAARRKALLANNFQTAGSQLEQTTLMNRFYTWRQRYWSLEALRMQQEEMNTVGRILILTCALLVLGKTQYSLHAVCTLAETSMTDLHFHTSAFGIAPLLREHLTDVAKLKAIKRDLKRGGKFRSRSIRADTKLENRQFFDPNASVNADPEYPPVQDAPAQPSRPRIHVPRRKPNSRSRSIAENQDENSSVKVNPRKLYEPVHLTGRNISRERERELERLKRTLEELAEPLPEPEAKRHKPKETADNSME